MKMRLVACLTVALLAGLAHPVSAQLPIAAPPIQSESDVIPVAHPRAAVLTVFQSGAEAFLLDRPSSADAPLPLAAGGAALKLGADYEALFLPLTAGWARFQLAVYRELDSGRELLATDNADVVDFGPSRHAGRLVVKLALKPGLHKLQLVSTAAARAVAVPDWTTDEDTATLWVLVPAVQVVPAVQSPVSQSGLVPVGPHLRAAEAQPGLPATRADIPADITSAHADGVALGGLAVGAQRAVSAGGNGGAINFETGHNTALVVRQGQDIGVWSEYALWWAEESKGSGQVVLDVDRKPPENAGIQAPIAHQEFTLKDGQGPRLERGALDAHFHLDDPGMYQLYANVQSVMQVGDKTYRDADSVPFTVRVVANAPRTGSLAGKVASEDGAPLGGVVVEAMDANGNVAAKTQANDDGVYQIDGLAPGKYLAHANPGDLNYLDQWWKGSPNSSGATGIDVQAGSISGDINFALIPGGSILGRVTNSAGKGLGGIEVVVGLLRGPAANDAARPSPVDPELTARLYYAKTNDEGWYSIGRLPGGRYFARARDLGGKYLTEYYKHHATFAEADPVVVQASKVADGIDFSLQVGGAIAGQVREQSTLAVMLPLPKILVEVLDRTGANPLPGATPTEHVVGSTLTDREGRYQLGALAKGEYWVRASDPNGKFATEYFKEAADVAQAKAVPVQEGTTTGDVDFTLARIAQKPVVFIDPAYASAATGGSGAFAVAVKGVENLAAFEVELGWDPAVIKVDGVELGAFLGSTGRQVVPVPPQIDNTAGRLRYAAATIGTLPGPSGGGKLFAVKFSAVAAGSTDLKFGPTLLMNPAPQPIDHSTENGLVKVGACMFGDFDCNCRIDIRDIMEVVRRWGTVKGDPDFDLRFDLDANDRVDIIDVQIEASLWGRVCQTANGPLGTAGGDATRGEPKADGNRNSKLWPEPMLAPQLKQAAEPASAPKLTLAADPARAAVGQEVHVWVDVSEAGEMDAFELAVAYDPTRLRFAGAKLGSFLEHTGRTAVPVGPSDEPGASGVPGGQSVVHFGAFTLPGGQAPGGSGRLAEFTFVVTAVGDSTVNVSQALLTGGRTTYETVGPSAPVTGRGPGQGMAAVFLPVLKRNRR